MSSLLNQEVVHEGWLTKSPPTKRIWRARWRRRWFALRQSGDLPGQYCLDYYTDRNCRKLKGSIDLDQCDQVDAGLRYEQRKLKHQFMFDIKTKTRTYYLAAETEQDMNSWVECICHVCNLKNCTNEDQATLSNIYSEEALNTVQYTTNSISTENTSTSTDIVPENNPHYGALTGPYIPISQCITGRPLSTNWDIPSLELSAGTLLTPFKDSTRKNSLTNSCNDVKIDSDFYDSPRKHCLTSPTSTHSTISLSNKPSLHSPTDSESFFTDEEWSRGLDHSLDLAVLKATQKFMKISLNENEEPPPRPPKPLHLINEGHNYTNLNEKPTIAQRRAIKKEIQMKQNAQNNAGTQIVEEKVTSNIITDDMYDFPRSHIRSGINENVNVQEKSLPRHCYNNAAPMVVSSTSAEARIFKYDSSPTIVSESESNGNKPMFGFDLSQDDINLEEPASPCSQSSSSTTAMYSNLPSPLLTPNQSSTPPAVNRDLKPRRSMADSTSLHSLNEAPSVNRKLKPVLYPRNFTLSESTENEDVVGCSLTNFNFNTEKHDFEKQMKNLDSPVSSNFLCLQYLDLDLEKTAAQCDYANANHQSRLKSLTAYKTVDFLKTEAFNRTKKGVEAERKMHPTEQ